MTALMLVVLLYKGFQNNQTEQRNKISKRFLAVYFVFIFFSAMALWLNGEYNAFDYNKWLLANYLNCFVTYVAIDYFITDKHKIRQIMVLLLAIIVADAFVTILQFVGNPIGKQIAIVLTTVSEVQSNIADDGGEDLAVLFGEGLPIGFFGHVFTNGTLLAVLGILFLGIGFSFKGVKKLGVLLGLAICLYASFAIQERMAFFMLIMMALYLFFTDQYSKRSKSVLIFLLFIAVVYILPQLIMSGQLGRLVTIDFKEDTRGDIWSNAFIFLKDHLLLGGPVSYNKMTEIAPHNFFLFVFIYYGLLGGLVVSILYISMTIQAVRILLQKYSRTTRALAASVCIYNLIALFHNASIATGDTIIFILYPLMLKSVLIDKNHKKLLQNESSMLY